MNKLDMAKRIIKAHIKDAECGIYDVRNWIGDPMETIYENEGLQIDICYEREYFEVFGLTDKEFQKLKSFYKRNGG